MQQPRRVDVRWEWISQGWEMYSQQMGNWLLISLIVFLVSAILIGPVYAFMIISLGIGSNSNPQDVIQAIQNSGIGIVSTLMMSVVSALLQAVSYSGYYHVAMKQLRGEQISVGDFFAGLKNIVQVLIVTGILAAAQFVVSLIFCVGTILSLVISLASVGLLLFTYPLIADRNMGALDAVKASIDVTKQNPVMFILFGIVAHLIGGIGILACCIGVIFTAPLLITIVSCAYRDCFGSPGGMNSYTPPPPPNYGGYEPPPPPPPSSWQ